MKKKFAPPQALYLLAFLLVFMYSCKKIETTEKPSTSPRGSTTSIQRENSIGGCFEVMENDTDTLEVPTILGNQLLGNPYSLAVMQQASINLYGNANGITVNKLYVRFKPANSEQLFTLESLDLDLYDYPLDFELLHEGDYYPQSGVGPEEIPWFYGVVDVNFQPPAGIQYEILQEVYIPATNLALEREAFMITGNPYDDSCGIVPNRFPPPCEIDPCAPGCPLGGCDPGGGGGGGGNIKQPSGNLYVWDNQLASPLGDQGHIIPVRRIRVVARNFLKIERVYTDDNGRYQFTKNFNKVTLVVKMKNNNTTIRGILGWRFWNVIWPLKKNIGKYKGDLTNIFYTFFRQEHYKSRGMQDWIGATIFNKRMDYNGLTFQDQLPGLPAYLDMFIASARGSAAAPMFPHRAPNNNELIDFFIQRFLTDGNPGLAYSGFLSEIAKRKVDVFYGYRRDLDNLDSDDISEVIFHELSHAQHYNKVGNDWWHEFVLAELTEAAINFNNEFFPYGQGNTANSPMIALAESWAYHYGRVLADRVYGNQFSSTQFEQGMFYLNDGNIVDGSNFIFTGLNAHINYLEDFSPNRPIDPFRWIPNGVYYDLIDDRNDFIASPPRVLIDDQVAGYTHLQLFNALDSDVFSMSGFRIRFLLENGFNQAVVNLFAGYNY
jgi:hypothetical protein